MTTPQHRASLRARREAIAAAVEITLGSIFLTGLLLWLLAMVEAIAIGSGA